MTSQAPLTDSDALLRTPPEDECDVVMKGGITSGVVYPMALHALGARYRIRGIGGASAGAIGAAVGAAAEFGRSTGGFERLRLLPGQLGDGRLAALFQPQPSTKKLLPLLLVATGNGPGGPRKGLGKAVAMAGVLCRSFPLAGLVGAAPGAGLAAVGAISGGWAGWLLFVAGVLTSVIGWCLSVASRLWRNITVDVPGNLFGICRGIGADSGNPGFTDWLCDQIDLIAGLPVPGAPLTFGQLWTCESDAAEVSGADRQIDLRMITTSLSEGVPYEMPWDARRFFFDPAEWRSLFPERVVAALEQAPAVAPGRGATSEGLRDEELAAARHEPALRRLPDAQYLPVAVATRLSLSFPLLIAAVPLWTIDRGRISTAVADDSEPVEAADPFVSPASGLHFSRLWFTDGGFCSNFPVHLFDAALPVRPTFAINLGRFSSGRQPSADERENVEWAHDNRPLLPRFVDIPTRGVGALLGFASAALNTSRNWQDSSHLDQPGYRDRVVQVLQTKIEGGLNLHMDSSTIDRLAERGRTAATVIIEQFTEPRYPARNPVATGWDNHRWVRYRALLSVLPEWLRSYERGQAALDIELSAPPSYRLKVAERALASHITGALDDVARVVSGADPDVVDGLTSAPRPKGLLRRIPQI